MTSAGSKPQAPQHEYLESPPEWEDHEKPTIPGSPGTPYHTPPMRVAYLLVGILISLTGGLGNAFISANQFVIAGDLALTPVEMGWLSAVYVMCNVTANLILFKCRQQFGVTRFAEYGILAYVLMMAFHLFTNDYTTALIARAVSGFATAPLSAMGFMYILQAFPKKYSGSGLCIALGMSQVGVPLAWIISPSLVDTGDWKALYLFELGVSVCALAAIAVLRLPTGMRIKVIEKLDFLTFLIIALAIALVCGVLAQGRIQWWTDQPWMAYALITSLALFLIGGTLEFYRKKPLIQIRWLGSSEILHFVIGAVMMRILLSEQSYGAAGLLRTLGMGPDQLVPLYVIILLGTISGFLLSALFFGPKTAIPQILFSVLLIGVASSLDITSTNLTRPQDMYLSQYLIACASGMFIGPLLLSGITHALKRGSDYIVTFIVLFGVSQGIGGLAGPALYGTFQQWREHEYSAQMSRQLDPTQAKVTQALNIQSQAYRNTITDPMLRTAQGQSQLGQIVTREANVRAYNDVFKLNMILALAFLTWSLVYLLPITYRAYRQRRQTSAQA